jgi:hypothetical protein
MTPAMPPNDQPPSKFMTLWLDSQNWFWDEGRHWHEIILCNHVVRISARKRDWTWRCKRISGFGAGVVTIGFGFKTALDARRDVLATFWSDLWTGRREHEMWRNLHVQKPLAKRLWADPPEIITNRAQWAAEIETGEVVTRRTGA